jgi:ureidoglycolate lyase
VELELQPLSAAAFAPYGEVIGIPAVGARATVDAAHAGGLPVRAINGGTSQRFDMPGGLDLHAQGGQPCVAVFRARAQTLAGPWRLLERHRMGTQTFIPLAGARCVVLVARGEAAPGWITAHPLAAWPALWDRLGRLVDETEKLNMDRKQAVLTGLSWLSA